MNFHLNLYTIQQNVATHIWDADEDEIRGRAKAWDTVWEAVLVHSVQKQRGTVLVQSGRDEKVHELVYVGWDRRQYEGEAVEIVFGFRLNLSLYLSLFHLRQC